jgi:hypothetical protein
MLIVNTTPKEYTMARQTIPFLVSSDLFDTQTFDVIERSFKYLFEVKTLRDDGVYRTFSTVAIPPRPDNLTGLFDPSKIIQSAIDQDNGTQKLDVASPMPRSIVQFRIFVSERYLDNNGEYVTGDRIDLGIYYAVDAGSTEGLTPYVIEVTGTTKDAMHHHQLLGDQLVIRPGEPLTVSFFTKAAISASLLDFIHGDYGSFDYGQVIDYSGITKPSFVTLSKASALVLSGQALTARFASNAFTSSSTVGDVITFQNLNLEANKTYEFTIFARLVGSVFNFPGANAIYTTELVGAGIDNIITQVNPQIRRSYFTYSEIKVVFTTNSSVNGNEVITIEVTSPTTNDLARLNSRRINFDSAVLKEIDTYVNPINKARIVVNKGLASEIDYEFETDYLANVIPFDEISKARFDCPIGLNSVYDFDTTGTTQNANNQFLDGNGNVGKFYRLELFNDGDPSEVIATTKDIYQVGDCQRYNNVRLKWLNELGAWDYYTFDKVSIASTQTQREVYKITGGRITGSDNNEYDYTERDIDRGYKSLTVLADDYIIINSDWVKNETGKYLRGILTSPEVFILNPEPYIDVPVTQPYELEYPVIIEDTEFEFRNNSSEAKLVNATFRIKIAVPFNDKTTNIEE